MDNIMPKMMEKLYQMIKLSKGDPGSPTLTKSIKGPYKDEFMHTITQEIKELEQHVTWTIVYRNPVTGAPILPLAWAFKFKRFTDGRLQKFKAIFCARGDIKVEELY